MPHQRATARAEQNTLAAAADDMLHIHEIPWCSSGRAQYRRHDASRCLEVVSFISVRGQRFSRHHYPPCDRPNIWGTCRLKHIQSHIVILRYYNKARCIGMLTRRGLTMLPLARIVVNYLISDIYAYHFVAYRLLLISLVRITSQLPQIPAMVFKISASGNFYASMNTSFYFI